MKFKMMTIKEILTELNEIHKKRQMLQQQENSLIIELARHIMESEKKAVK